MSRASRPEERVDLSDQIERGNQELERLVAEVDFQALKPQETLRWASEAFPGRAAINTSFQISGVAMIHMAADLGLSLRYATIDTLRLHPETYDFIDQIKQRYGCSIEVYQPAPVHVQQMVDRFGEYLFFDSVAKREYCCQVRKTRPNDELVKTLDCWIAGLRKDQSVFRQENAATASMTIEYGSRRKILKLNPISSWTEEQVWDYTRENEIPVHPLYGKGFASFGCIICSTPIRPGEDKRAGRWRWFNNEDQDAGIDPKECGLHYNI